jgi:hypothetical protein
LAFAVRSPAFGKSLLRPPPENALQEWIVSPRVNRSGVGDDDSTLIEPTVAAQQAAPSQAIRS